MKKLMLLSLILLIILASGCTQQLQKPIDNEAAKPQEVFKKWFNSTINGNWNNVFMNMVDSNGNTYSEECKERFIENSYYKVGAQYQLNIKNITEEKQCRELPEYQRLAEVFNISIPNGLCVIISYSAQLKYPNGGTSNEETDSFLLKVNNEWKVIIDCISSRSTTNTTSHLNLTNATEEYQADKLNLIIDLPKTSFKINESVKGKFIVGNKGKPFETFVLFICRSKEPSLVMSWADFYRPECVSSLVGSNLTFEKDITACSDVKSILNPGAYEEYCNDNYFRILGNYTFEIRVYSCSQIANTPAVQDMEVNCSTTRRGVDRDEVIRQYVTPIKTMIKNVVVT